MRTPSPVGVSETDVAASAGGNLRVRGTDRERHAGIGAPVNPSDPSQKAEVQNSAASIGLRGGR